MKSKNVIQYNFKSEYSEKMKHLESAWSSTYSEMASDLTFASGGSGMWDKNIYSSRMAKRRPVMSVPLLHPYVERLVSPVRMHPPGMSVKALDKKIQAAINGVIRGIEKHSSSTDAYANALSNAATGGLGFLYLSVEEENGEPILLIKSATNPTSIMIDPLCDCIDGRDAKYACYKGFIDKTHAVNTWGEEAGQKIVTDATSYLFSVPENAVQDCIWYTLEPEGLRIVRTVGSKEVYNQLFKGVKFLPVVPVIGERLFGSQRRFGGIIRRGKDLNNAINITLSNTMELVAAAPKSPFIGAAEAFENFKNDWENINDDVKAYVRYKHRDKDGELIPAPVRLDNSPQTGALQSVAEWMTGLISRATGMSDAMLGGLETASESGKSLIARMEAAEGASSQYLDHLTTSISQLARVLIQMLPLVYAGNRKLIIIDDNGNSTIVVDDISRLLTPEVIEMLQVDVESGPHMELKRKSAANSLSQMITTAGDKGFALLDLWADTQDLPNAVQVKERLKKILPPELMESDEDMDGEVDPKALPIFKQAEEAIAAKDETIQYLEAQLANLQAQVNSQQAIYEAEIRKAEINAEVQLRKAQMEIDSKREIELLKQGSEDIRLASKLTADQNKQLNQIIGNIQLENEKALNKSQEQLVNIDTDFAAKVPEYVLDDITEAKTNLEE